MLLVQKWTMVLYFSSMFLSNTGVLGANNEIEHQRWADTNRTEVEANLHPVVLNCFLPHPFPTSLLPINGQACFDHQALQWGFMCVPWHQR